MSKSLLALPPLATINKSLGSISTFRVSPQAPFLTSAITPKSLINVSGIIKSVIIPILANADSLTSEKLQKTAKSL